jgi:hypothetical protein
VRLQVDASQLRALASTLAGDARELQAATVSTPGASEFGYQRLADAAQQFEATANTGVDRVAHAAGALADWMLLAADVAQADDDALASEFRAHEGAPAATRNAGASGAADAASAGGHP